MRPQQRDLASAATAPSPRAVDDWLDHVEPGQTVDLVLYGDTMHCRVHDLTQDALNVRIPMADQAPALHLSTAYGFAVVPQPGGAARVPVSARAVGELVRLQAIGPAEFVQRRQYVRHDVAVPVVLSWPRAGGGFERVVATTVDVSKGGLRVAPANTVWPSVGSLLRVAVELPGGTLHAEAETVGKTPDYGLRLRFTSLTAAAGALVDALAG